MRTFIQIEIDFLNTPIGTIYIETPKEMLSKPMKDKNILFIRPQDEDLRKKLYGVLYDKNIGVRYEKHKELFEEI
jgi:hypothetical protein